MRLIVCGGRDFQDHELFHRYAAEWIARHGRPLAVIAGGASGADEMGKAWAAWEGIPFEEYRADWKAHGRSAGPRRNAQMAAVADGCLALPGGRGTADMLRQARAHGLLILEAQP